MLRNAKRAHKCSSGPNMVLLRWKCRPHRFVDLGRPAVSMWGCIAIVSNAVGHDVQQFDTGSQDDGLRILWACARAFRNRPAPHR